MDHPAKQVRIHRLKDEVLEIYENLKKITRKLETKLSITQCRKVRQEGLIEILENLKARSYSTVIQSETENVISAIKYMVPGGDGRIFICHNNEMDKSKLEFACVAICKYTYNGNEVCDFLVTTYSYEQRINTLGVLAGAAITVLGFATFVHAIFTGEAERTVTGASFALTGLGTSALSSGTSISSRDKDILEAFFTYELVQRDYAELKNGELYFKVDDND